MGQLVIAPLLAEFLRRIRRCRSIFCWSTARSTWSRKTSSRASRRPVCAIRKLVARKLADLRMIVCASPDYLARRGMPRCRADLAHSRLLVFSDAPGKRRSALRRRRQSRPRNRISGRLWMPRRGEIVGRGADDHPQVRKLARDQLRIAQTGRREARDGCLPRPCRPGGSTSRRSTDSAGLRRKNSASKGAITSWPIRLGELTLMRPDGW